MTDPLRIETRLMRHDDIPRFPYIADRGQVDYFAMADIASVIDAPDQGLLIALDGDASLAGFAHIRMEGDNKDAHLRSVYVMATHRGQGVGNGLVKAAGNWALAHEADTASLHVSADNAPARSLYEKSGFAPLVAQFQAVAAIPFARGQASALTFDTITPDDWPTYRDFQSRFRDHRASLGPARADMDIQGADFALYDGRHEGQVIYKGTDNGRVKAFALLQEYSIGKVRDCHRLQALFIEPDISDETAQRFMADIRRAASSPSANPLPILADARCGDDRTTKLLQDCGFDIHTYYMTRNVKPGIPAIG